MTLAPSFIEEHFDQVTVLASAHGGAFPYGNTVVVRGSAGTLVIDPSLEVDHDPVQPDAVMISHHTRTTSPASGTSPRTSSPITPTSTACDPCRSFSTTTD